MEITSKHCRRAFISALLLPLLIVATVGVRPARAGGKMAIIVHKDNGVAAMTIEEVKAHFLKKKGGWTGGDKIRPADQGPGAIRSGFLSKVLAMSAEDFDRYWIELKYVSAESPPKGAGDSAGVLQFVASNKGGIGYVDAALAAGAADKVKVVLTVDY